MVLSCSSRLLALVVATGIVGFQDRRPASAAEPPAIPRGAEPDPPTTSPEAVIRLYRTTCLKCHDTDGKGEIVRDVMKTVPDFTDTAWHATRNDAELRRSILDGKGKSMPAMR